MIAVNLIIFLKLTNLNPPLFFFQLPPDEHASPGKCSLPAPGKTDGLPDPLGGISRSSPPKGWEESPPFRSTQTSLGNPGLFYEFESVKL